MAARAVSEGHLMDVEHYGTEAFLTGLELALSYATYYSGELETGAAALAKATETMA